MNKYIAIVYNTTSYVYKFRINLIKEIKKLGYRVIVISPKDGYVDKLKEEGIEHHHINISQYGMIKWDPILGQLLKTIFYV